MGRMRMLKGAVDARAALLRLYERMWPEESAG